MHYDLAIIGAGSAGLSLAAAAAQFGERVVLFEAHEMGGDCLNTGCVPSKALLAAAKQKNLSYPAAMAHVEQAIAAIAPHDSQERFEGLGVSVVRAAARFTGPTSLVAADKTYTARRIVIATGSRAALPPIPGLAQVAHFTNETIFKSRELPRHLIIIGAGPIGLEMALAHRRLGAEVTVLEAFQPLAKDDPELAQVVLDSLKEEGITIRSGVKILRIETEAKDIRIVTEGESLLGSHLLVAAGRAPNLEGLDLEKGQVAFSSRGITVDKSLRSVSNRRVYAAGDVAGGLQFTHVAGYHAGLIIRNALFRLPVTNRADIIPWVTYTDPELAHVGLNEAEARKVHGESIRVLRSPFSGNDRAITEGKTKGLIKVVTSPKGVVLGASIVGQNAGDQIALWALAVQQKLKISAIANLVLPYPTFGEAGKRAAVSYYAGLAQKPVIRRVIRLLKAFS